MFKIPTIRWMVKNFISDSYVGYALITKYIAKNKDILVNDRTDIVIEGYPRSGNTFCVAAFQYMQKEKLYIARHRHELGQVLDGIRKKKPVLVIIREPSDAISSFVIRENVSINFAIKYYINYYKSISLLKDKVMVANFIDVINDLENVILKLNDKYKTKFRSVALNKGDRENITNIVKEMEKDDSGQDEVRESHVAYPTLKREQYKDRVLKIINQKHQKKLVEANDIYKKFL